MRRIVLLGAAVVLLFAGLAGASHAATRTWAGGFGPDWSQAGNWGGTGLPLAGDTVVFPNPATSNANLGSVAIAAIVLGPNSGGSVINGAVTIDAFAATYNIDDQSTSATPSTINAAVAITAATLYIRSQNAAHTLNMSGVISGNFGVQIFGPGSVAFSGGSNNTYTGSTSVVSSGTLLLSGTAIVLVPGNLNIGVGSGAANSAKVKLTSAFSDLIVDTSKVTIASDGQLDMGSRSDTIAQLSGTGSVTMSGSNILTVGDTGNFTFGGVISGTGNVNKVGTGSMTYTAANTYTGLTTVSRGTLVLSVPVIGGSGQAFKGPLSIGLGVGAVTTATVQLANNVQIDSTTLPMTINSDGKLDTAGFRDNVGPTTINGGSLVIGNNVQQFGGLTMTGGTISGAGTLVLRGSNVVATSTLALGASTINLTVELGFATDTITVNSGSTQPELTINSAVTSGSPGGSPSNLTKTGTGTLRLAGSTANTYGGSTTIALGVLELAKPINVVAITGPIVIGNGTDAPGAATLKNLASNQIGGNSTVQINPSGKFDLNGFAQLITSLSGVGAVSLPTVDANLRIGNPTGATATYDGVISGIGRISKEDAGTQIFTQNNPYTGTTFLLGGTLIINGQQTSNAFFDRGALSGTGRIGNAAMNSSAARLRPGVPGVGGTLSTGNVVAGGTDLLVFDLTSPSVFGKLNVTGTVALNNAILSLLPAPGFTAPIGTLFEIVTNDGTDAIVGTFQGLPQGATVSAGSSNFTISYTGGTGNDITLTVAKNTPVMTLSATVNPVFIRGNTQLSLTVASVGGVTPTGTVAFSIAGTPVSSCAGASLSGGVAQCSAFGSSLATAGTQSITAVYSGDANYSSSSAAPLSLVVADATSPFLQVSKFGSGGGTVTSVPAGISCGADCTEIFASGTAVTLTATANADSVFTGWDDACTGPAATCTLTITSAKSVNATFALRSVVGNTPNIDIDGDGKYRAATDGLLISRFVQGVAAFNPTGAVAAPAVGGTATRITLDATRDYLFDIYPLLDVDRNGLLDTNDSIVMVRYLLGFRGAALIAGVTLPVGMTAAILEANLLAITPVLP